MFATRAMRRRQSRKDDSGIATTGGLRAALVASRVQGMKLGRVLMGGLYIVAGIGHFVATRIYVGIMPDYLPDPRGLVLLSGGLEICGGVGLLVPQTRRFSAYGIAAMLVTYLPVHIWMIQHHRDRFASIPLWALWVRLPLQAVLIVWALRYAGPHREGSLALPDITA